MKLPRESAVKLRRAEETLATMGVRRKETRRRARKIPVGVGTTRAPVAVEQVAALFLDWSWTVGREGGKEG